MKGQLGHLLPQGPIFSSHNTTAQCTVCAPFLLAGGWDSEEKKHSRATGEILVWPQCQLRGKASSLTLVHWYLQSGLVSLRSTRPPEWVRCLFLVKIYPEKTFFCYRSAKHLESMFQSTAQNSSSFIFLS